MKVLEMILIPIISLLILFVLTKIMGYRQITQLNMYDYIIGITLGSIASEFIITENGDYLRTTIAMVVYTAFTILLSTLSRKSQKARRLIDGHAIILYENDCLYNVQLDKAKMDIDEFLMQCRINGYFNLNEIGKVVLETNGNLSFLPKEKYRPTQLGDLNVVIQEVNPPTILIKEGKVYQDNVKKINKDMIWLENTIQNAGASLEEILLMYQEDNTNIQLFKSNKQKRDF